jgi:8-oxo-dGTP pyrophosphatase MutT (NUDIX family)
MVNAVVDGQSQTLEQLVQTALQPGETIPIEQLLVMRGLDNQLFRAMEPPVGVTPRQGAVLILFYRAGDALYLPLTVRSHALPSHRGEVSLPGGATDPDDNDAAATALRECHEELGIAPETVHVWGSLTPIYIPPSNFRITPVVGYTADTPVFQPNHAEVSQVLNVGLHTLLDPVTVVTEQWSRLGSTVQVPFFAIDGYKVWGATALILSELIARIHRVATTPR